jgi:hypothetical protein
VKTFLFSAKEIGRIDKQVSGLLNQKLGLTHVIEYDIQLLDNTPVRLAPYRLAPPKMQYLREHIKKLLRDGVIEHSFSNYSSPKFLVPKSAGGYRAVVDFRVLNKHIAVESVPVRVPLVRQGEIFYHFRSESSLTSDTFG